MNYYNKNAENFFKGTVDADTSEIYRRFEKYLKNSCHIADIGCGSGRDSKYFKNKGYIVTATDLSEELSALASKFINQKVLIEDILHMDREEDFDAAWACASLLHINKENIITALKNVYKALKENGIFYASFKYGEVETEKDGRIFNNYTEKTLKELLLKTEFKVKEIWITGDVREGRKSEKWINVIVQK